MENQDCVAVCRVGAADRIWHETDIYHYSKNDERRAYIMPSGVSNRGSVMWQVIDVKNSQKSCCLERRTWDDLPLRTNYWQFNLAAFALGASFWPRNVTL